jgi:hypothetical protein
MRRRPGAQLNDPPPGRYRVVEKNGRLVVVDNESGIAVPPTLARRAQAMGAGGLPRPVRRSVLDATAALMVRLVVRQWDEAGRAVIDWKWGEYGKTGSWHALLDEGQQRRFGRALLALAAAALLILAAFTAGLPLLGFAAALPLVLLGSRSVKRLKAESDESEAG